MTDTKRNKLHLSLMLALMMPLLFACLFGSAANEQVHIRIKNDSSRTISRAVLGSGEQNGETNSILEGRFTFLDPGETSPYHSLDPVEANYNFIEIRFVTGERRVTKWLNKGRVPFEPEDLVPGGYYTMEFDFVGDEAIVNLIVDPAP